ncbi:hypothetical protein KSC_004120 [Ktedonobacter sp. SOSP1-52]|uniref:hypothetical protein n=1 Tax=Ktedonobacter sp. SOSP1-52 TaxID=2778366 RepID=UPI0019156D7C|nr:hypothetical protein [Ktedonobacter sp. SOSP1-52]GHO61520.1 hypothetical protein KSC_004120 [Ktedonobacter sp. SOSP1-52]
MEKIENIPPMRSLTMPLSPPVHLLTIDGMPKLMAGGDPQHARMLLGLTLLVLAPIWRPSHSPSQVICTTQTWW